MGWAGRAGQVRSGHILDPLEGKAGGAGCRMWAWERGDQCAGEVEGWSQPPGRVRGPWGHSDRVGATGSSALDLRGPHVEGQRRCLTPWSGGLCCQMHSRIAQACRTGGAEWARGPGNRGRGHRSGRDTSRAQNRANQRKGRCPWVTDCDVVCKARRRGGRAI